MGEKVQGIRSIICRLKIDREKLRIVQEMESWLVCNGLSAGLQTRVTGSIPSQGTFMGFGGTQEITTH